MLYTALCDTAIITDKFFKYVRYEFNIRNVTDFFSNKRILVGFVLYCTLLLKFPPGEIWVTHNILDKLDSEHDAQSGWRIIEFEHLSPKFRDLLVLFRSHMGLELQTSISA